MAVILVVLARRWAGFGGEVRGVWKWALGRLSRVRVAGWIWALGDMVLINMVRMGQGLEQGGGVTGRGV